MSKDPLNEYRRKRNLGASREPAGGTGDAPRFVIQKQAASRLHYDFRLAFDGALTSWAGPKGPSPAPPDKRLAGQAEAHPRAYARCEDGTPRGPSCHRSGLIVGQLQNTHGSTSPPPRPARVPCRSLYHFTTALLARRGLSIFYAWSLIPSAPEGYAGEAGSNAHGGTHGQG